MGVRIGGGVGPFGGSVGTRSASVRVGPVSMGTAYGRKRGRSSGGSSGSWFGPLVMLSAIVLGLLLALPVIAMFGIAHLVTSPMNIESPDVKRRLPVIYGLLGLVTVVIEILWIVLLVTLVSGRSENVATPPTTTVVTVRPSVTPVPAAGGSMPAATVPVAMQCSAVEDLPVDLHGCNFDYQDLSGRDFSGRNLAGASFRQAHLASANLANADLTDANLMGADLTSANLGYANLARARLSNAQFDKATLRNATMTDTSLRFTDFLDADLTGADFTGAVFSKTRCPDGLDTGRGC